MSANIPQIPFRSKLLISKNIRIYNITELVLILKDVIDSDKNIQINLNTIRSIPIFCTYYYHDYETETSVHSECLIFYQDDEALKMVDNVELDKIVDWIKDNPEKVEKICRMKMFI